MTNFELSPDGKTLVVRGRPKNSGAGAPPRARLYVRRMGSFDMTPLAGTEGAKSFTFSPDGRWIAFVAPPSPDTVKNRLAKVPLNGSAPPLTIGAWNDGWGLGAWLPDGDILVTAAGGTRFLRLSSKGGPPGKPFEPVDGSVLGDLPAAPASSRRKGRSHERNLVQPARLPDERGGHGSGDTQDYDSRE